MIFTEPDGFRSLPDSSRNIDYFIQVSHTAQPSELASHSIAYPDTYPLCLHTLLAHESVHDGVL